MSIEDRSMGEKRVLAQAAVDLLNDLLKCDRVAIEELIEHRVFCTNKLLDHPLVQGEEDDEGNNAVGMLGIINALFGTVEEGPRKGWGLIAAVFDDGGGLVRFEMTDENLEEP